MILLVFPIYIVLAIFEFVPLYKQERWKDLIVNAALFLLSLATAILLSLNEKPPSPEVPIREFITLITGE